MSASLVADTTPASTTASATAHRLPRDRWQELVADYRHSCSWRASWQLINTLVPYGLLTYLIYVSLGFSIWLTLGLMLLAAAFLVRLFIIFHDCVHGSFFGPRLLNDVVGMVLGTLTFTPYYHWRGHHMAHHATSGDLGRRGAGDVWTLTVREYLALSAWKRCLYRLARNPAVLFVAAPLFYFIVSQRFCRLSASRREHRSVYGTNAAILAIAAALCALFGIRSYLIVQMGIMMLAGTAGLWLFYVQHQFEGVYWERGEDWDYASAALRGSSYYKLPGILRWFSGNIGFHHIHHLSPRIPNYHLRRCHDAGELFRAVAPVTLLSSLRCLSLRLWDERRGQLVGFRCLQDSAEP